MNNRWGSVTVARPKDPSVEVSFNRGDEVAMRMIAMWFGLSYKEFLKIVPPEEPTYLGCGCLEGTHESSLDAMKIQHPDIMFGYLDDGLHFF